MNYKDIASLSQNSHLNAAFIAMFLSGIPSKRIRIEYLYLLFPLLYNRSSRERLKGLKSTSTLESALRSNSITFYSGMNLRYEYFKRSTSLGLVICSKKYEVSISNFVSIQKTVDYKKIKDKEVRDFCKASYNFGRLLIKEPSADLFVKFGILQP